MYGNVSRHNRTALQTTAADEDNVLPLKALEKLLVNLELHLSFQMEGFWWICCTEGIFLKVQLFRLIFMFSP